jgi:hypothetical protein
MPAKKKTEKNELTALYVGVASLDDLARSALSERQTRIIAVREAAQYRLLTEGEKPGDFRIIYYFETQKIGKYLIYKADEKGERAELADTVESAGHYNTYKVPIIEMLSSPYAELKKGALEKVARSEARDYGSMVRSLVNHTDEDSLPPKLYAFFHEKSHVVGSFELFWEHHNVFAYAKIDSQLRFSVLNYDYNTDTIDSTGAFPDPSKIRVRVINLAEPFPFFKTE